MKPDFGLLKHPPNGGYYVWKHTGKSAIFLLISQLKTAAEGTLFSLTALRCKPLGMKLITAQSTKTQRVCFVLFVFFQIQVEFNDSRMLWHCGLREAAIFITPDGMSVGCRLKRTLTVLLSVERYLLHAWKEIKFPRCNKSPNVSGNKIIHSPPPSQESVFRK